MRYLIIVLAILTLAMPVEATSPEPIAISDAPSPYVLLMQLNINQDDFPLGWEGAEIAQPGESESIVATHIAGYALKSGDELVMAAGSMLAVSPEIAFILNLDNLMPVAIEGYVKGHWNVRISDSVVPSIGDTTASYCITSTTKTGTVYTSIVAFTQFDTFVIVMVATNVQDYDTQTEAVYLAQVIAVRLTAYQYPDAVPTTPIPTPADSLAF